MKIGVCLFDDPNYPDEGWASVNGLESERIDGIEELGSDTYWITNVPFMSFIKTNLNKMPNMFDEQYFRTSIKNLSFELGITNNEDLSEKLSEIFFRLLTLAQNKFNLSINSEEYRFSNIITKELLPLKYAKIPEFEHKYKLINCFKEATQINQAMTNNYIPKGTKAKAFTFPRGAYARWILSLDYPSNKNWKELKTTQDSYRIGTYKEDILKGTKALLSKLQDLHEKHSIFIEANVENMEKMLSKHSTFGAGSKYSRRWVTFPELENLVRYATIRIGKIYYCDSEKLDILEDISQNDEYSISRGLLYENIWCGLSNTVNKDYFTPLGAYMHAYDRVACQNAAEYLSQHNIVVGSYSTGRVLAYVNESNIKQVAKIALEAGLFPPTNLVL